MFTTPRYLFGNLVLFICSGVISLVDGLSPSDWVKKEDLLASFFIVRVPGVLPCGKLCERQSKCAAVTYDTEKRTCYLHDAVTNSSVGVRGKHLYSGSVGRLKKLGTPHKCRDTELYIPATGTGGTCRDIQYYMGCYKDAGSDRDLQLRILFPNSNSRSLCLTYCYTKDSVSNSWKERKRAGYKYIGLQYGRTCWCGNSFGKHGTKPETDCNMSCTGNATETCGGSFANSIYGMGL